MNTEKILMMRVVSIDPLKLERVYLKEPGRRGLISGWSKREAAEGDLERVRAQHAGRYVLVGEVTLEVPMVDTDVVEAWNRRG